MTDNIAFHWENRQLAYVETGYSVEDELSPDSPEHLVPGSEAGSRIDNK